MAYIVATTSNAAPVLVEGKVSEIGGSEGISSKKGHDWKRSACIDQFNGYFGPEVLVQSSMKMVHYGEPVSHWGW